MSSPPLRLCKEESWAGGFVQGVELQEAPPNLWTGSPLFLPLFLCWNLLPEAPELWGHLLSVSGTLGPRYAAERPQQPRGTTLSHLTGRKRRCVPPAGRGELGPLPQPAARAPPPWRLAQWWPGCHQYLGVVAVVGETHGERAQVGLLPGRGAAVSGPGGQRPLTQPGQQLGHYQAARGLLGPQGPPQLESVAVGKEGW